MEWEEIFPIKHVESEPYSFYCIPCDRKFSCRYNGKGRVKDHCQSLNHISNVSKQKPGSSSFQPDIDISPESTFGTSRDECKSRDISVKSSPHPTIKSVLITSERTSKDLYSEKQLKKLDTSNQQHSEVL
ncbi:hypothetical protein RF11_15500 [Thelohanellus kitauei]|uniref:Uncharacterized protein n=1 Tax=Thelohanellus kitauei TaxID=669202 RepID=A0A0C2I7Q3_THEKT|nr:hypothetical protein RF11_15500 [Thelohanellus kitauei]